MAHERPRRGRRRSATGRGRGRAADPLLRIGREWRRWRSTPVLRRAARRRLGAWIVVVAVASSVHHVAADADAARRGWGEGVEVAVVTDAVPAGGLVAPHVEVCTAPRAVVAAGALRHVPAGARAGLDLAPGQVLTPAMLEGGRRGAAARALPAGTVGVAVTTGPARPPVEVGDHVDLVAPPGDRVTRDAEVVGVEAERVTLAVRAEDAPAAAAAALSDPLALVLLG